MWRAAASRSAGGCLVVGSRAGCVWCTRWGRFGCRWCSAGRAHPVDSELLHELELVVGDVVGHGGADLDAGSRVEESRDGLGRVLGAQVVVDAVRHGCGSGRSYLNLLLFGGVGGP